MNETMDRELLVSFASNTHMSAMLHATAMAVTCLPDFAELVRLEASKFARLDMPNTNEKLIKFQSRSMSLSGKIASVSHASSMAKMHSSARGSLHELATEFCDRVSLDDDVAAESMALNSKIRMVCQE